MGEDIVQLMRKPWESVAHGATNDYNPFAGYVWENKEWQVKASSGKIIPVQIEAMAHGDDLEVAIQRGSPRLSYAQTEAVFDLSAKKNITLMEATIIVMGDEISPAFREKMENCPVRVFAQVEGRKAKDYGVNKKTKKTKEEPAAGDVQQTANF